MMRTYIDSLKYLLVCLLVLTACSEEEATAVTVTQKRVSEEAFVTASATVPQGADTRLKCTDNTTELAFYWNDFESFHVISDLSSTPVVFSYGQKVSDITTMTVRSKEKVAIDNKSTYYAVYPQSNSFSNYIYTRAYPSQTGKVSDIGNNIYMYAKSLLTEDIKLNFQFEHLTSVLKVPLKFDNEETPTQEGNTVILYADKIPNKIQIDFTKNPDTEYEDFYKATNTGNKLELTGSFEVNGYAYFCIMPGTYTNLSVTVKDGNKTTYKADIADSYTIEKGKMYVANNVNLKRVVNVGDFMLKNGSIINKDDMDATDKANAIGMVVYKYANSDEVSKEIKNKLKRTPTGLVMTLKDAPAKVAWGSKGAVAVTSYNTLYDAYTQGQDGYNLCNTIELLDGYNSSPSAYPAVYAAKNYTPAAPSDCTTGWYLPSIGEWIKIVSNSGVFSVISGWNTFDLSDVTTDDSWKKYKISVGTGGRNRYTDVVNSLFSKVGSGYYGELQKTASYLSSTEYYNDGNYIFSFLWNTPEFHSSSKDSEVLVRPILAF